MSELCPLCPEFNVECPPESQPKIAIATVKTSGGRETIVQSSLKRQDGRDRYLCAAEPLIVHTLCRKDYTRDTTIISQTKNHELLTQSKEIRPPLLRSAAVQGFDIKNDCVVCGKEIEKSRNRKGIYKESDRACQGETLPYIEKFRETALKRNDDVGNEVLCRLSSCIDLPAAEVKYHNNCRLHFFREKKPHSDFPNDKEHLFICATFLTTIQNASIL